MRASRLVSILLLLQGRGKLTARQLADALEVSVRTVYRDIESLSEAGVPVYGDAGPDGGYQLLGGYRTRLTGLTAAEAQALSLAGMPRAAAELGLGTVLATAQLKLQAALPAELRERTDAISERFLLDAPGWYHDGDSSPYLAAVAGAVLESAPDRGQVPPVDGTYGRDEDARPARDRAQGRQVVSGGAERGGHRDECDECGGRRGGRRGSGMRTYRINHVLGLTDTGERFTRAEAFDLAAFWAAGVAGFRTGLWQGEARIRLSPAGRERAAEIDEFRRDQRGRGDRVGG